MSHQPPVPAGNQSPYPLQEVPHPHAPEPPAGAAVAKTPGTPTKQDASRSSDRGGMPALGTGVVGLFAAGAVAAIAAAGAWAYSSRSHDEGSKQRKGKRKKH